MPTDHLHLSCGYRMLPPNHQFERQAGFPYWTLALSLSGTSELVTRHGRAEREAPNVLLIQPNMPYRTAFVRGKSWEQYWAILAMRPQWQRWVDWPVSLPGVASLTLEPPHLCEAIHKAFDDALAHSRENAPAARELAANAIERVLLLAHRLNPRSGRPQHDARIAAALDFMQAHLTEPMSVQTIAAAVHLSPSHLAHRFRAQVGQAPMRYLESTRLQRAQELLLSTNDAIRQIADAAGFASPYHFSARFRARIGCTPSEYRADPSRRGGAGRG